MARDSRRDSMGCLTDAVAFYFNLHPERVPLFVFPRRGWLSRLKAFYRRRNCRIRWVRAVKAPARGTHLVCGDSLKWKRASHVVVYRNGRLVFDPSRPSQWTNARITHRLVVTRKNKR